MNPINIYTDGACSGNPGPGAYAYLIDYGHRIHASALRSNNNTTNNQMELQAVISALQEIKSYLHDKAQITVYSDSKYVIDGINQYLGVWLQNGWRTSTRKDVANMDLWKHLVSVKAPFTSVTFVWVKGHANCPYNNICDRMAQGLLTTTPQNPVTVHTDTAYEA